MIMLIVASATGLATVVYPFLSAEALSSAAAYCSALMTVIWALGLKYRDGLAALTVDNNLSVDKFRRLRAKCEQKRTKLTRLIFVNAACTVGLGLPWITMQANEPGIVYQWSILLAGFALGIMISSGWLIMAWSNDIIDTRAALVEHERVISERLRALEEVSRSAPPHQPIFDDMTFRHLDGKPTH